MDERDGGREKDSSSAPVVYQLVRVQGDGKLVPATDDDVMEVEQFFKDDRIDQQLEDDNCQLPSIQAYDEGCLTNEDLFSKNSVLEEAPQIESSEGGTQLNAKIEIKQETTSKFFGEHCASPNYSTGDVQAYNSIKHSTACTDKFQGHATSKELSSGSERGVKRCCAQIESTETASKHMNDSVISTSCGSEACMSSIPDFSLLKGEVCLDKLSIRELQEVFKATFGRHTSVKDKLWLKRRIAMGLTNSCNVPTTNLIIKNDKIIQQESEEAPCRSLLSMAKNISIAIDQIDDHTNSSSRNLLLKSTNQTVDEQLSGKRLRQSPSEHVINDENLNIEQCAAKRLRKPTKRYIEELSELDSRETTTKSHPSVKSSPKSRMTLVCDDQNDGRNLLTRCDSVGRGFNVEVSYVSRIRSCRPRKDYIDLMSFAAREKKTSDTEELHFQREVDLGCNGSDFNGDIPNHNTDFQLVPKDGARRKHHRAWTLCEVLKLVEGVARYGAGRWSEIRRVAFASYPYRTSVDLKDKWRNLLRASLVQQGHGENGERNLRKHTSIPIPSPILCRVRELAALQEQVGNEITTSKSAEGKRTGFL